MLRFALAVVFACSVPFSGLGAEPASKQERSVEKFMHGTDADRDAMLKQVVRLIGENGYRDVAMIPWFVMVAIGISAIIASLWMKRARRAVDPHADEQVVLTNSAEAIR